MGANAASALALFANAQGAVATNFTIFAQIYTALFGPFQSAVNSVAGSLSGTVAGWVTSAVVVMMMLYGAARALTVDGGPAFDQLVTRVLIPAAVVLYILNGNYTQYVSTPATQFAASIGNTIVGNIGGTVVNGGAPFDAIWNKAYAAGIAVFNAIPTSIFNPQTWGVAIAVVIYWISAAASIGFAFVLFLASQAGMYLLLAIGPLFVGFGAFQFTRFLLKGYVSALASVICAQVIVLALLAISFQVINTILSPMLSAPVNANPTGMVDTIIITGILLGVFAVLAFKSAAYAVGICGGIFDGLGAWIAAAGMAGRALAAAAPAVGNTVTMGNFAAQRPFTVAGRNLGAGP